jgi:hypothetical protein
LKGPWQDIKAVVQTFQKLAQLPGFLGHDPALFGQWEIAGGHGSAERVKLRDQLGWWAL